jgi:anti-anti-sigma factor
VLRYEVIERHDDYVVLELRGELTQEVPVERLHETLKQHYVDDGVRLIRIELAGVDRIDLDGAGVLLALWREASRQGKRLVAENPQASVRSKLTIMGVLRLLEKGDQEWVDGTLAIMKPVIFKAPVRRFSASRPQSENPLPWLDEFATSENDDGHIIAPLLKRQRREGLFDPRSDALRAFIGQWWQIVKDPLFRKGLVLIFLRRPSV